MLVSEIDRIKYEIASYEAVLQNISKDSLTLLPLTQKIAELKNLLSSADTKIDEARAVLYFFGDPVKGSRGIESSFLGETLTPFQQLVSARVANKWKITGRKKGKFKDLKDSTLFLTGTPRGSFGVELRKLTTVHVSHESHLAEALQEVVTLMESTKDQESFDAAVVNSTSREILAMKKLFGTLKKGHAGVILETGNLHFEFSIDDVNKAYEIISEVKIDVNEVEIIGRFRGVLLNSRTFNFTDNSGTPIKGSVSEELTDDDLEEYNRLLTDTECLGTFEKINTSKIEGDEKPAFILKSLEKRA